MLGSISVAVYRSQMADSAPERLSSETVTTAEDTLGGATQAAEVLPGALGESLLDAARDAFAQGMHVAAVTGAGVAIGAAIAVGFLLRRGGPGAPQEESVAQPAQALIRAH